MYAVHGNSFFSYSDELQELILTVAFVSDLSGIFFVCKYLKVDEKMFILLLTLIIIKFDPHKEVCRFLLGSVKQVSTVKWRHHEDHQFGHFSSLDQILAITIN